MLCLMCRSTETTVKVEPWSYEMEIRRGRTLPVFCSVTANFTLDIAVHAVHGSCIWCQWYGS